MQGCTFDRVRHHALLPPPQTLLPSPHATHSITATVETRVSPYTCRQLAPWVEADLLARVCLLCVLRVCVCHVRLCVPWHNCALLVLGAGCVPGLTTGAAVGASSVRLPAPGCVSSCRLSQSGHAASVAQSLRLTRTANEANGSRQVPAVFSCVNPARCLAWCALGV
jgi:hypothetical protein